MKHGGRHEHKKVIYANNQFSMIHLISMCGELAYWRPIRLQAPLLAEKVPCTEAGEGEGRGTVHLCVFPNGGGDKVK